MRPYRGRRADIDTDGRAAGVDEGVLRGEVALEAIDAVGTAPESECVMRGVRDEVLPCEIAVVEIAVDVIRRDEASAAEVVAREVDPERTPP